MSLNYRWWRKDTSFILVSFSLYISLFIYLSIHLCLFRFVVLFLMSCFMFFLFVCETCNYSTLSLLLFFFFCYFSLSTFYKVVWDGSMNGFLCPLLLCLSSVVLIVFNLAGLSRLKSFMKPTKLYIFSVFPIFASDHRHKIFVVTYYLLAAVVCTLHTFPRVVTHVMSTVRRSYVTCLV